MFHKLLDLAGNDQAERKSLLAGKAEDMINSTVRQISFHDFETRLHTARRQGSLTKDQLGAMWLDTQAKSLGDGVKVGDGYKSLFGFIPHFVHVPFYVYAYGYANLLVEGIYEVFAKAETPAEKADFVGKYRGLLEAGGSRPAGELLAPLGIDTKDPTFWKVGLGTLRSVVEQLEAMDTVPTAPTLEEKLAAAGVAAARPPLKLAT